MVHHLHSLIENYGYIGIIILLIGGVFGLPLPDEIFLTYIGYSVYREHLAHIPALASAVVGAIGGVTLSYYIGYRFGLPLLLKYGPKIYITEQKINSTKKLFDKIGPAFLFIGFFIPGVRHISAYIAAINKYSLKKFTIYAYSGAFAWTLTFITIGRVLGDRWSYVSIYLSDFSFYIVLLLLILIIVGYYFFRKRKASK
ncbi:DedA family protein [Solibacillus sp. CAU 1738]|uniref:DedA family protein n=1 Tax=Solibacillus sp. CAU 1738 TaxID=3140363 RepID=UPI00325FEB78